MRQMHQTHYTWFASINFFPPFSAHYWYNLGQIIGLLTNINNTIDIEVVGRRGIPLSWFQLQTGLRNMRAKGVFPIFNLKLEMSHNHVCNNVQYSRAKRRSIKRGVKANKTITLAGVLNIQYVVIELSFYFVLRIIFTVYYSVKLQLLVYWSI